jgi:hypothetical protein
MVPEPKPGGDSLLCSNHNEDLVALTILFRVVCENIKCFLPYRFGLLQTLKIILNHTFFTSTQEVHTYNF